MGSVIGLAVAGRVIVESITGVLKARLLACLKLARCRPGLLANVNMPRIRDGFVRPAF